MAKSGLRPSLVHSFPPRIEGFTSLALHLRSWGKVGGGRGVVGRCRTGVLVSGHSVTGPGVCGDEGVRQVIIVKVGVRYDCRLGNCQNRDRPLSSHLPRWRGTAVARVTELGTRD